jgi:hypothetical protein
MPRSGFEVVATHGRTNHDPAVMQSRRPTDTRGSIVRSQLAGTVTRSPGGSRERLESIARSSTTSQLRRFELREPFDGGAVLARCSDRTILAAVPKLCHCRWSPGGSSRSRARENGQRRAGSVGRTVACGEAGSTGRPLRTRIGFSLVAKQALIEASSGVARSHAFDRKAGASSGHAPDRGVSYCLTLSRTEWHWY